MSQYYYLVASLPMLFYDSERPIPLEGFLELCRQHLSKSDYQLLSKTSLNDIQPSSPSCAALEKWRAWEKALRNELVKLRARRKSAAAEDYLVEYAELWGVADIARSAFNEESPLLAEEILNRARWARLDALEMGHYFDTEKLVLYYLRLQLLERKRLFAAERGSARFKEIYAEIIQRIYEESV